MAWDMAALLVEQADVFCGDPVTNGQFHSIKENNYSYKVCHYCYNIYYNNDYSEGNNEPFDFS